MAVEMMRMMVLMLNMGSPNHRLTSVPTFFMFHVRQPLCQNVEIIKH